MFGTSPEDKMDKDLLSFCIEAVLLRMGIPEYENVVSRLEKDYGCTISDCDRNPEFLKRVLLDIFGEAHTVIIDEIRKKLGESGSKKYFADFIAAMKND